MKIDLKNQSLLFQKTLEKQKMKCSLNVIKCSYNGYCNLMVFQKLFQNEAHFLNPHSTYGILFN